MIIGVLTQWRGSGIDWCFYARIARYGKQKQISEGEACYVMESNLQMTSMMKALRCPVVNEYTLYGRDI